MDRETFRTLAERCDPGVPLWPEDPRYVDLSSRRSDIVEPIAHAIVTSVDPVALTVAAPRGAGLSTELRRLSRRLEADGIVPVLVDVWERRSLTEPPDATELLLFVLAGLTRTLLSSHSVPELATWNTLSEALDAGGLESASAAASDLRVMDGLMSNPGVRAAVHNLVARRGDDVISALIEDIALCEGALRRVSGARGVAVLVDSLTLRWRAGDPWPTALGQALAQVVSGVDLPVHAVWSSPVFDALQASRDFCLRTMRLAAPGEEGLSPETCALLTEVLRRRVSDEVIAELMRDTRVEEIRTKWFKMTACIPQLLLGLLEPRLRLAADFESPPLIEVWPMFRRPLDAKAEAARRDVMRRVRELGLVDPEDPIARALLREGYILPVGTRPDDFDVYSEAWPTLRVVRDEGGRVPPR